MRERLLAAARELFSRRGFNEVSVRELAAAADVTPAMIHYYFGDKRGLYEALFEVTLARLLGRLREAAARGGNEEGWIAAFLEAVVTAILADPWMPPLVAREVFAQGGPIRERFIESYASKVAALVPKRIRTEIASERFRQDLDPKLAFVSLVGMTAFPFVARPVLERAAGLRFDEAFCDRFVVHTRRLFLDGVRGRGK